MTTTKTEDKLGIYKKNTHSASEQIEHPWNDPCRKEHQASLKCLDKNNYDNDACTDYFANYTLCRKFWKTVTSERYWKGIRPSLPPFEEREEIKAAYMKQHKS